MLSSPHSPFLLANPAEIYLPPVGYYPLTGTSWESINHLCHVQGCSPSCRGSEYQVCCLAPLVAWGTSLSGGTEDSYRRFPQTRTVDRTHPSKKLAEIQPTAVHTQKSHVNFISKKCIPPRYQRDLRITEAYWIEEYGHQTPLSSGPMVCSNIYIPCGFLFLKWWQQFLPPSNGKGLLICQNYFQFMLYCLPS